MKGVVIVFYTGGDSVEIQELKDGQKEMGQRIGCLEQDMAVSKTLMKQNIETNKELSVTLKEFSNTLININNSISHNSEKIEEMGSVISKIDNKVDILETVIDTKVEKLEERIDVVEEKDKFDIMLYVKQNFIRIVLAIGVGVYVVSKTIY